MLHAVVQAGALGLLGLWFAASAAAQVPRFAPRIRRWDPVGLVPNWSFFAPNPATHDYHLLYRDQLDDGNLTDWTEIPLIVERRWWAALWNPARRQKKALFDATSMLMRQAQQTQTNIELSVPYLLLLMFVSSLPRPPASAKSQFLLMASEGPLSEREPGSMFLSGLHPLEAAADRR